MSLQSDKVRAYAYYRIAFPEAYKVAKEGMMVTHAHDPELGIGHITDEPRDTPMANVYWHTKLIYSSVPHYFLIPVCRHCRKAIYDHVGPTYKCLFGSSAYYPETNKRQRQGNEPA